MYLLTEDTSQSKIFHLLSILSSLLHLFGGARRNRTADPLLARQMLSQLSYGPSRKLEAECRNQLKGYCTSLLIHQDNDLVKLVGLGGFEPPTSPLSGVRSNQLSYRP